MIIMQKFPPPSQLSQPLAPRILTQCEPDRAGMAVEGLDRGANGDPEFSCGDILQVNGESLKQHMLVNLQC